MCIKKTCSTHCSKLFSTNVFLMILRSTRGNSRRSFIKTRENRSNMVNIFIEITYFLRPLTSFTPKYGKRDDKTSQIRKWKEGRMLLYVTVPAEVGQSPEHLSWEAAAPAAVSDFKEKLLIV